MGHFLQGKVFNTKMKSHLESFWARQHPRQIREARIFGGATNPSHLGEVVAMPREAGITTSKNGSNLANRDKEIKTSRGKRTSSKETLHLTQSHSLEEEALFQEEVRQ